MGLFDFFKKNHKSNTEKLDEVPKYPANISVPLKT